MKGPCASALLTDLYQMTMLQAYWQHRMNGVAVFELFVRKLPPERAFLVAAGLEQALDFIEQARFDDAELEWVERSGTFAPGFADWLGAMRFSGDVWAMPEGTVFFPNEPILRVVAPIAEAQWLETRILNLVHFQTVIASRAARAVLAADGHALIDFGLRRAHGAEAGVLAARAAYLAGFTGTATAYAGPRFGIPVFGTMAHSFVQAHDDEAQAFIDFAESFPANAMLLIDTYDTVEGARRVARVAPRLAERGIRIRGVRLDSGDLDALARDVRRVLDDAGLREAVIFASGNLDEKRVQALVSGGAPIDSFGVGTSLTTSSDAAYLDAVYKLQEYAGQARRKRSTGKATWPGRKQVFRTLDADGRFAGDAVALADEAMAGEPLLVEVMHGGRRVAPSPSLAAVRAHCARQLAALPPGLRPLEPPWPTYPVTISPAIRALANEVDEKHANAAEHTC
ncbi:MAG TPA: nicotinate phosphoribosyltransferase [Burkholderiaceae bacterium]|nr:nicotinate phosphoribosyltransferase [Burkholderiaceae bacterium]